jgi:ketosteroid isomerase-like protein
MRSVKLIALALAAICLLAALAWSQGGNPPASTKESGQTTGHGMTAVEQTGTSDETVKQEIKTLQGQLMKAILKSDTSFFEKYYDDDYAAIHGDGKLTTKAQEIESFKSGATKYESIDVREAKIRTYGDTAIVNALVSVKTTVNGKPYSGDVRNTRVWVKQNGNWKLVVFQATRVPSASQ